MGGYGGTADAHGSGPCEGNFMKVQILLSAPAELLTILRTLWVVFFMTIYCILKVFERILEEKLNGQRLWVLI